MNKPPINHVRQRRLTKVFFEDYFHDEELVFIDLIYGSRKDYSYRLLVFLRVKGLEGSYEVQSKINECINDYVKTFGLNPHLSNLLFKGDSVTIDYLFSDIEFHNYKNELFLDLEEFLQFCSDSHLEDETEMSHNPVYSLVRELYRPEIEIDFVEWNDLKKMKKFSELFVQMLTNNLGSDKFEILEIELWENFIRIPIKIVFEQ